MSHVCLLSETDEPALFCGDTLFNAGAGNCHNGGHPNALFDTFVGQLDQLAPDTRIFPGHDYIENNLRFTIDREPANDSARALLEQVSGQDPATPLVTTLALERDVNTFFRLQQPGVIERLREAYPELGVAPSPRDVFVALRELRNRW
jgi:hydroxyacylglutathione hydrolase